MCRRQLPSRHDCAACLPFFTSPMHVLAGRRTTGAGISCFALLITRTLYSTFESFGIANSVRVFPPSPRFPFFPPQTAACLRICLRIFDASALVFVKQGSWYGPVMPATLAPLHMPFGPPVCSFSPSWRCTAGGKWKKTAAICKPS